MANDLAALAKSLGSLPDELQRAQRRAINQSALLVTRTIRTEIRISSGGDNRLSGVGRRGAKVGAKYDVKGVSNVVAIVRATGPLHFIEHPTSRHAIPRPGPRRGRRALRFANGDFRASAMHPGTRPSKPFERGYLKSRDKTGEIWDRNVQQAIRKAFG